MLWFVTSQLSETLLRMGQTTHFANTQLIKIRQTTQMVQEMSLFWWHKVSKLQWFFFSFSNPVYFFFFLLPDFTDHLQCIISYSYTRELLHYFSPFSRLLGHISSDCCLEFLHYISCSEPLLCAVSGGVIRNVRPVLHGGSTGGSSSQVQPGRSFLSSPACPASSPLFQTGSAMFSSLLGLPVIWSFLNSFLSKWPCLF